MATRLYMNAYSSDIDVLIPPDDTAWWTGSIFNPAWRWARTPKDGDALNTQAYLVATIGRHLWMQLITDQLSAQALAGTFSVSARVLESATNADSFFSINVRSISGDGDTVRATLLQFTHATESPTSIASRYISQSLTASDLQWGDRICIELGFNKTSTNNTTQSLSRGSSAATDLDAADGDTGADNPWFEFSQTLTFGDRASRLMTMGVGS